MSQEAMEDSQNSQSGNSAKTKLQRYPLRSGAKSKEKPVASLELSNSMASSKRVRATSSVSKSVSVLDLSGKEKPAKPPRRLSIPAKSTPSPAPRPPRSDITPISEVRAKRADSAQRKLDTPVSDISRHSIRKKFSILSSSSYWLSQIKLSEAAAKHSISLGFFKLALEAGCEPLKKMRDELTSYTRRHNLEELGESVNELTESYNVAADSAGQVQVSETCSQVLEEETRSSDDEIRSSSSTSSIRKPRLNATPKQQPGSAAKVPTTTPTTTPATGSIKKNIGLKASPATTRARVSLTKTSANSRPIPDSGANKSIIKKPQKPIKQEANKETKKRVKKSATEEQGPVSPSCADTTLQENKENMDASTMEEITMIEVV